MLCVLCGGGETGQGLIGETRVLCGVEERNLRMSWGFGGFV